MHKQEYPRAFACYNRDTEIRLKSTSGGMFTLLGEYILRDCGGVVFGAAFDSDFAVHHVMVDRVEDLNQLRGSKYPQSNMGLCYREAQELLEQGRTVLYTGAPCQIEGLHQYLGREYENLFCMDFVCHGVASPGVWQGYLSECRKQKEIQEIVFKDKIKGWKRWYVKIQYKNRIWYRRGGMEPFMRSYLKYANIRPSCYQCRFKGIERISDFTISDCWGAGEHNERLNDNKGLSALLVQNEKAQRVFETIKDRMVYEEYDPDTLMERNWTTYRSVSAHVNREAFFRLFAEQGAKDALGKYFAPRLNTWLRYYYLRFDGKEK